MTDKKQKVLLIRLSSMGDIVLTSPVVRWLKLQKDYEVHFLTKKSFSTLVAHNPNIDKTHFWDEEGCLEKLKDEDYRLIIDLHKSLTSRKIRLKLGKPFIDFKKLNVRKWAYVQFKWDVMPKEHLVDRYLQALKPLGIADDGLGLDFYFDPALEMRLPALPEVFDVLVLGAAHATKRIPSQLAEKIIGASSAKIFLIGGKDVAEEANGLESKKQVVNLAGKLSIPESAELIRRARYIHTGDTGMMHIAAALKKPMTVYWGNTTPQLGMYPFYGAANPVKWRSNEVELSCRPCSKLGFNACPKGHFKCMLDQEAAWPE